ncbi:MAG: hypothetical protein JWO41_521 [Candidatus Saccharibacteria bacterium]|nr:hypothetical protein [Candidatus Saccharibacteria bacterium]
MPKISYVVKIISIEVLASAVSGLLACVASFHYQLHLKLNFDSLVNALVSLNSGIIIAIFLALFHSSNANIENFRKFTKAAKQLYMIFLINCIIACVATLFVANTNSGFVIKALRDQQSLNIIFTIVSIAVSLVNVNLVYKLISIQFRDRS